jgi:excisionase family DNA binding protein
MDQQSILPEKPYLKTAEVARAFNVDQSTVFLWTKKNKLRPIRTPGGTFRFAREDVRRLLETDRPSPDNRRKEARFMVSWPVMLHMVTDGLLSSYEAEVHDVSASGMGLIIHHHKTPRKNISINALDTISIVNSAVAPLKPEISAQVRFCSRINETDIAVGVQIL